MASIGLLITLIGEYRKGQPYLVPAVPDCLWTNNRADAMLCAVHMPSVLGRPCRFLDNKTLTIMTR
ncbi:MAG: hypothetical protein EBR92_09745 [Alphaproteobacteria bacterium]|nr:hypothetical protein [Alphaproteobacteria bacterium]